MTQAKDLVEEAVEVTRRLVRIDTTSGSAGEATGLQAVAQMFADDHGHRVVAPRGEDGRPTGLVVLPTRAPLDHVLLFSAHVDTVPADASGWAHDPWGGALEGGHVYGRGSSDMKGGLAAAVSALRRAGGEAPVALAVTRGEELGGVGVGAVVDVLRAEGVGVAALICGEPTDGQVVRGHRGPLWLTVTTRGRSAHASAPSRGDNAVDKLAALLARARTDLPLRTHPELGRETATVTTIRGGTARNVVPAEARAQIDLRLVDPDIEPIVGWYRAQPEHPEVAVDVNLPVVWSDADDPWIRSLPGPHAEGPVPFGTEAGPFALALGVRRAAVWGPGSQRLAHAVEERVSVDLLAQVADGYLRAARAWR